MYWQKDILTKYKSTILDGPKILFAKIQAQINLFSGTNELIRLKQNCYFVHRKNLLLAMLGDEHRTVRAKAGNINQKIIYAEEGNHNQKRDPVREFHYRDPGVTLQQHLTLI